MNPEEVVRRAVKARDCAADAADALEEFVGELRGGQRLTSEAAALAYEVAVGHLNVALAELDALAVRRSAGN